MKNEKGLEIVEYNGVRMTRETAMGLRSIYLTPRPDTRPGQEYDKRRAMAYFEMVTGEKAQGVIMARSLIGDERHPRIKAVRYRGVKVWEIPFWDWNAHNLTVEQCWQGSK